MRALLTNKTSFFCTMCLKNDFWKRQKTCFLFLHIINPESILLFKKKYKNYHSDNAYCLVKANLFT